MKNLIRKSFLMVAAWLCLIKLSAQNVYIPDANFRAYLQTNFTSCMVGPNSDSLNTQCSNVLSTNYLNVGSKNISDLTGIQYFAGLQYFYCDNNNLTSLPALANGLIRLECHYNQLSSLPSLPASLQYLYCYNNQLTSLPSLPNSLIEVFCRSNQLTSLPALPNSMTWLDCPYNLLTSLPVLPNSLVELDCFVNQLIALPSLPTSLTWLNCRNNQLSSLPILPNALGHLDCSNNQLIALPPLPLGLGQLICNNNQLTSLPALPGIMTHLYCENNLLTCLPMLPFNLNGLSIDSSMVKCIPNWPQYVSGILVENGSVATYPICTPANSQCIYGGNISGIAYHDANINCQYDTGEFLLKNRVVEIKNTTSSVYASTDSLGYYYANVDTGSYMINHSSNQFYTITCPNIPYSVTVTASNSSVSNLDFPIQIDSCDYLTTDISTTRQRVGVSNNSYYVNYCNNGIDTVHNAYIEITFAPEVFPLSSTLPWSGSSNNTYTFTIGSIAPMDCGTFVITDSVDVNAIMNQAVCATVVIYPIDTACYQAGPNWNKAFLQIDGACNGSTIDFQIKNIGTGGMTSGSNYRIYEDDILVMNPNLPALGIAGTHSVSIPSTGKTYRIEVDQVTDAPGQSRPRAIIELCGSNPSTGHVTSVAPDDADAFIETSCIELVNSYDPNDKKVMPKGFTANNYIYSEDELEYTIQFQNTGNDTAYKVTLSDTIDVAHLDITTIEPCVSSHPYQMQLWGASEVIFIFNNINLLPASVDSLKSQGFVKFKIKQKANNPVGTDIDNKAYIYFDYNTPIITNVANVEIFQDATVGISMYYNNNASVNLYPNPFTNELNVNVGGKYKQTRFELYDVLGAQIISQTGGALQKINMQHTLASGVYIYKVYGDGELISSGKVIAK